MALHDALKHYDPQVGETSNYISAQDAKNAIIQTYNDMVVADQSAIESHEEKLGLHAQSILLYGADPTGVNPSDSAFAQAIANHSSIYVPAGTYRITQPIVLKSGLSIYGDIGSRDAGDATKASVIIQYSNAEFFTGVDLRGVTLKELHLTVNNKATHTKDGVVMTRNTHAATNYITIENVHVVGVGRDGFSISNLIVSAWKGVTVVNAGRHGFNIYGVEGGAAGTSVSLDACYANTCGEKSVGHGFKFRKMVYCSLSGCASEGNSGASYHLSQVQSFTLNGCGSEYPKSDSYVIDDTCLGTSLIGCWAYLNVGTAFKVANNCQVQLIGCVEMDPVSGVASITTDNTSTATVVSPTYVTDMNLGTKTVLINEGMGGIVVPGTAFVGGSMDIGGQTRTDSLVSYGSGTFDGDLISNSDLYARASIQIGTPGNYNDLYRDGSGALHTSGKFTVDGNFQLYGDMLGGWAFFQYGADFGSSTVGGVLTPTNPQDAANKSYVDTKIALLATRMGIDPETL